MRKFVNIVWLEDNLNSIQHELRRNNVISILETKGYSANIDEVQNYDLAKSKLNDSRVDFFITDFNISGGKNTGLTFLKELRKMNGFKQFVILYSNNSPREIKDDVIKVINTEKLDIFSNFTFFSLADRKPKESFKSAIDTILCRWDELNALRGMILCENAEIEFLLRESLNRTQTEVKDYSSLIKEIQRNIVNKKKFEGLFKEWWNFKSKRDMMAHIKEGFDKNKGYSITSQVDAKMVIYESDIDDERKKIIKTVEHIKLFLENYDKGSR